MKKSLLIIFFVLFVLGSLTMTTAAFDRRAPRSIGQHTHETDRRAPRFITADDLFIR